jgi:hypothetical protein
MAQIHPNLVTTGLLIHHDPYGTRKGIKNPMSRIVLEQKGIGGST